MVKDKGRSMDDYLRIFFWVVAFIFVVTYLGILIYNSFNQQEGQEEIYKFEITGVVSEVNATTAASLHFECIKYCIDHTSNDYGSRDKCYDACQTIGKELD
jgi:hypothetical protein